MATKRDLQDWVVEALRSHNGKARIVDIARHIWETYERDLRGSGDLFFTWQYDMRWAATRLRSRGTLRPAVGSATGLWELK